MKDNCSSHTHLGHGSMDRVLDGVGLRKTPLRLAMMGIFSRHKRPQSQKELLTALHKEGLKDSDRVSVYRNLRQFVDSGIIHEVAANSYVSCKHLPMARTEAHVVLFCNKCERHEEVCNRLESTFFSRLMGRFGFFATPGQLLISGVCRNCS